MANKCPLVPLNEDQFKDLCKEINLKPEQLDKDVKTLAAWIKLQPHLPQDAFDEMMLGAFITSGKNSLEIAKQKIDMYLTNRLSCPELYGSRDPYAEDIIQNEKVSGLFTLLQTTSEGYRVNMNTIIDTNPDNYNYIAHIKRFLNLFDVRFKSEKYLRGDYFIFDLKGVSVMHITKCTPSLSKKFVHCIKDSTPLRVKGLFFINAPSITEMILNIFKPFLGQKLIKRIHVFTGDHTNLYKFIQRDILPNEYGGKAGNMNDLHNSWNEYVKSHRNWFLQDVKRIINESKRPEKSVYKPKQLFGIEGSFKTLTID